MDKQKIKNLVENKAQEIELKKAAIKYCEGGVAKVLGGKSTTKGLYSNSEDKLERTIIGNTYYWLDSHDDVHAKGCFSKSLKERQNKIFHLHDHKFERTAKVGNPISIYEKEVQWKDLGVNKMGETEALHMDSEIIKAYNSVIFNEYKDDLVDQHSVGMQYVKIDLAVNDEEYEEEYKLWQDNIDKIGNSEVAQEKGYFWLVREAKLIEISAVLLGSNEMTPTLGAENNSQAEKSLDDTEADIKSLQKFVNLIKI